MKGGEGPPADVQQDVEPGVKAGAEPPTERAAHLANHKSKVSMALQEHVNNKRMRSPWRWGARRGLIEFYNRQNSILDGQLDMEAVHRGDANFDTSAEERYIQRALNLSFVSNVILLGVRAAMVALAGSLSLIIALIDAVLDVLSSCMMYYAAREARKPHNKIKYPVGKERMEPLGVIVFSCVMATAAFSVIIEGIKQLASKDTGADGLSNQWIIIGGTILMVTMKALLYMYCRGSKSASVAAFATDHLNDTIVNSFSLAGALLGAHVEWWLDPAIAIGLSLWVMWSWGRQGWEQLVNLVGISAPPEMLQKLTYLAYSHCPESVKQIDTVKAYTAGTLMVAEVDIVLPPDMRLAEAHDIGESLQTKLELLPGISRAYVHLDVDSHHRPEH